MGTLTVEGVLADEFTTGHFRFDTTPQPLRTYVLCSNVSAFMNITVFGYMYEREPPKGGGGLTVYNFDSDYASGAVPSNGGAGCVLGE